MAYVWIILLFSLGFSTGCFEPPRKFMAKEAKEKSQFLFFEIRDTNDIGAVKVSENVHSHWWVTYNKIQDSCRLFMFHMERPHEPPIRMTFPHKRPGFFRSIHFEDLTSDGEYELLLEIKYDYGLVYQGTDLLIIQHPFSDSKRREVFNFPLERVYQAVDTFDADFGTPHYNNRTEYKAKATYYEDIILLRGVIKGRNNHLLEYKWDDKTEQFRLLRDQDLKEADEEGRHGHVALRRSGQRSLVQVSSHEPECKSFVLEDAQGHVIDLPHRIEEALLCTQVAGLAPGGRYLVFSDRRRRTLEFYDTENNESQVLLANLDAHEGISEILWSSGQQRQLAFVALDAEEYPENTRLFIYHIDLQGRLSRQTYDLAMNTVCEPHTGFCAPEKDYDWRFGPNNSILYRPLGDAERRGELESFSILPPKRNAELLDRRKEDAQ